MLIIILQEMRNTIIEKKIKHDMHHNWPYLLQYTCKSGEQNYLINREQILSFCF